MPRDLLADGNIKATWCTAIADIANPTVAELTAGVSLEWFITKDGLDLKADNGAVDNTALASTQETSDVGLPTHDNSLTFKRKDQVVDDIAFNTLTERAAGFLVVRRNLPVATAYAATQSVEVYPSRCGRPALQPPAKNTNQTVMVKLFNYADCNQRATVAA